MYEEVGEEKAQYNGERGDVESFKRLRRGKNGDVPLKKGDVELCRELRGG